MSKVEILRWLLFIPASFAGFFLALLVMIFVQTSVEFMCPEEYVVFGEAEYCVYPAWANIVLTSIKGALAAFLVVLFGTLVAPSHKRHVPYVLVIGGAAITYPVIAQSGDLFAESFLVLLLTYGSGILTAGWLSKRYNV